MKDDQTLTHQESPRSTLDKRLEDTGWGLFLVTIGCLMLVINGIRYLNGIRMKNFYDFQ